MITILSIQKDFLTLPKEEFIIIKRGKYSNCNLLFQGFAGFSSGFFKSFFLFSKLFVQAKTQIKTGNYDRKTFYGYLAGKVHA